MTGIWGRFGGRLVMTLLTMTLAVLCLSATAAMAQMTPDAEFIRNIRKQDYGKILPYLVNGGNVNGREFDGTPALLVAVEIGDASMVKTLLEYKANPDLFNREDRLYQLPRLDKANPTLLDRLATYSHHEIPGKHEAGLALVASIVERGEKVVCWSNFLANLDQFSSLVEARLGVPCYQVDGRVPTDDDPNKDDP